MSLTETVSLMNENKTASIAKSYSEISYRTQSSLYIKEISSEEEFQSILIQSKEKLVVVDFFATWCPPCSIVVPYLNKWSEEFLESVIFLRVNIDIQKKLTEMYYINVYPTFVFFRNTKEVYRVVGAKIEYLKASIKEFCIINSETIYDLTFYSEIEARIRASLEIINFDVSEIITVDNTTGQWLNKGEIINWKGEWPISRYEINKDESPEIILKKSQKVFEYDQNVFVKYLKPPPLSPHGEILIFQEKDTQIAPAPPLIIRQQPPRPITPLPLVIREKPPKKPIIYGQKIITISGKKHPPPPRKVVIEILPELPTKPRDVILEKWLPYTEHKRGVFFIKNESQPLVVKPKNVIIKWEPPKVINKIKYGNLGTVNADPDEYIKKYGNSLVSYDEIPQNLKDAFNLTDTTISSSSSFELFGDVEALKLVDLQKEDLKQYEECIRTYIKSDIKTNTTVDFTKADLFCLPNGVCIDYSIEIIEINDEDTFYSNLRNAKNKLVLIYFYSNLYQQLTYTVEYLQTLSVTYSNILFYKVNIDVLKRVVRHYEITSYSTFIFFRNSEIFSRFDNIEEVEKSITLMNSKISEEKNKDFIIDITSEQQFNNILYENQDTLIIVEFYNSDINRLSLLQEFNVKYEFVIFLRVDTKISSLTSLLRRYDINDVSQKLLYFYNNKMLEYKSVNAEVNIEGSIESYLNKLEITALRKLNSGTKTKVIDNFDYSKDAIQLDSNLKIR